jgi:thiol-disulfide isomerase/thioredoxin
MAGSQLSSIRLIFAGILIGLGLLLIIAFGFGLIESPINLGERFGVSGSTSPVVGSVAPDFELQTLRGESLHRRDLEGKLLLMNFWATWCAPCVIEMPIFQRLYEKYGNKLNVVAINADEPIDVVSGFVEEHELTYPILMDPGGEVQELYRMRGYPTSYFIDAEGVIRVVHIGSLSEEQVKEYLMTLGISE